MQIDFNEVERQHAGLRSQRKWAEAHGLAAPLMAAGGEVGAFGQMLHLLARYDQSSAYVLECLTEMDAALERAMSNPDLWPRLVLNAMVMAPMAGAFERTKQYVRLLKKLLRDHPANHWNGRALLSIACARSAQGDYKRAARTYAEAVSWHKAHAGPYGEHDQRCMIRIGATGLGETYLVLGKQKAAAAALRVAVGVLDDNSRSDVVQYLTGLLKAASGRPAEAVTHLRRALAECANTGDHAFRHRIGEMLALQYAKSGAWASAAAVVQPLLEECSMAELPDMVLKWQRLLRTPEQKEGKAG